MQTSSARQARIQSPEEARTLYHELKLRRAARSTLLDFITYTSPFYQADPFHAYVCAVLDRVVSGELKKVMIFAPPQHGKSMIVSEHFPAYWLGKFPDDPVLMTSYGARRARINSRKSRDLVERNEYRRLFGDLGAHDSIPVETSDDSRAADEWALAYPHRGAVIAAGVDGAITGFGAKLAIIDDPIKDWKEAQSATIRENAWTWYENTFLSRVWEGGSIVLIQTRWHAQDLAGRLIEKEADQWTILRFPAIAETQAERDEAHKFLGLPVGAHDLLDRAPGEPLAPKRFTAKTLTDRKSTAGWFPVYQQVPKPTDGDRFKRVWFEDNIVAAAPVKCRRVRYWDKAGSESESAKRTAGVLLAIDDSTKLVYIEDVVLGKWTAGKREQIIKETTEADKEQRGKVITYVEQEPGSGGKESADNTIRNLVGFAVKADRPTGDKDTRLEPFAAYLENGNVRMVRGSWNTTYVDEFAALPNGAYRDQTDATSGGFNMLTSKKPMAAPVIITNERR